MHDQVLDDNIRRVMREAVLSMFHTSGVRDLRPGGTLPDPVLEALRAAGLDETDPRGGGGAG